MWQAQRKTRASAYVSVWPQETVRRGLMVLALLFVASVLAAVAGPAGAADVKGSADHPDIKRYDGSEIVAYREGRFDEYTAILGPRAETEDGPAYARTRDLEGTVTRILYKAPDERSSLEILRNYQLEFREAGFEIVFTCAKEDCGPGFWTYLRGLWEGPNLGYVYYFAPKEPRYLAARLTQPGDGTLWTFIHVSRTEEPNTVAGIYVQLDVVEEAPLERNLVRVDPEELDDDLRTLGHTAIYGIYFDTDEARLKPESDQALGAITELMTARPELTVHVVGHTDSVGALDYNLDLSKRRAGAVVEALVNQYGVAASRLIPNGVGPLAPVASNRTEDGRAKNRRVELVEQP